MATHRGHNEGTIERHVYTNKDRTKTERFVARLPIDSNGKRPSLGSFGTRKEARQALKDAEVARAQGTLVIGKPPTVNVWCEKWLDGRTTIAHRTRIDYQHTWQVVFPYIGHIRLDHLTGRDLGEMWRKLARGEGPDGTPRKPLAATTLAIKHVHLKAALRSAVRSRHVPLVYNPADEDEARPASGSREEIHPFSEAEVQRLFAATKDDPDFPVWVTLITTGCRPSELRAMRWRDIDFEHRRVSINGSLYRETGKGHVRGRTKTKKDRVVSLRPETVKALRSHRAKQAEMRLFAGSEWQDLDYIFTKATGGPLDENTLRYHFDLACKKAGVPRRKLKETRHTFATLGLINGTPVKIISEALGHSSVKVTYDIYSHVIPGMQAESLSYLDRLFEIS